MSENAVAIRAVGATVLTLVVKDQFGTIAAIGTLALIAAISIARVTYLWVKHKPVEKPE